MIWYGRMTISSLSTLLVKLNDMKYKGGKSYKEVNKFLNSEATTDNIDLIQKFVAKNY